MFLKKYIKLYCLWKYDPHFKVWSLIHPSFETEELANKSKERLNDEDKHCIYFVWPVKVEK